MTIDCLDVRVDQLVEKYSSNTPFMMAYLSHRLNSHGTNWPPAKDTFKLLMENFNLPAGVAMNASTKRRRLDMTTMPTSSITRTPPLDGEDIAVFALDLARADMVSGSKQFLNRIGYESSPVDPLDFASMLIPLVRSAKDYFSELEEACTVSDIGLVAQMVLAAYVARYVGRRPGNMNDWTYRQAGCGCWDCRQLDQMLSNPTQRVIDFPGRTKKGRQHLHQMLDGVHGITHETERRKNTLVIRKIQGPSQRKDGEWKTRLGEANKQIHEFKNHFSDMPGPLEGLLGQIHDVLMQELQSEPENAFIKLEQKYRELQAKLKELVKPSQSAPLPATSSARPSIPMPVSSGHARPFPIRGVKRKAGPEIIDLTGED